MAKAPAETAEERLIAKYFRPLARHPGAFALMDDAAVLTPPDGSDLVLKTDAIVGSVHFFIEDPADAVARKALRVNLSDLAAKGATPAGFLLSLALPTDIGADWLDAFSRGLASDAERYGCPLLGGDTDRTPGPVTIALAAFGTLPRGTMVKRSGAKVGDRVVVTGTIGDAALGLKLRGQSDAAARWHLDGQMRGHLLDRYLLPQPRNAVAELVRKYATAAMDVSDGLAGDLAKLCRASGVAMEIETARVPLSDAARTALKAEPELIEVILAGGDDYEIVCTVPAADCNRFCKACADKGVPAADIGRVVAGQGAARFLDAARREIALAKTSFSHF